MAEQKQQQQASKKQNPNQSNNIQDKALNTLRKKKGKAQIKTFDGETYELDVRGFDKFTILGFEDEEDEEYTILFKHAIKSFRVLRKKKEHKDG